MIDHGILLEKWYALTSEDEKDEDDGHPASHGEDARHERVLPEAQALAPCEDCFVASFH